MNDLNGIDLASQLCSRVCHDLVNPIGALANGLELMSQETDPEMRDRCVGLLEQSVRAGSDRLRFFRLAFGGGTASTDAVSLSDVQGAVAALVGENERITVEWAVGSDSLPGMATKALLNLALIGSEALVRGGTLEIGAETSDEASEIVVRAAGKRIVFDDQVGRALDGALPAEELSSRTAPAVLIQRLAGKSGGGIQYAVDDEALVLGAVLPRG